MAPKYNPEKYQANKAVLLQRMAEYRAKNRDKLRQYFKKHYKLNKEKRKKYLKDNVEKLRLSRKLYVLKNKDRIKRLNAQRAKDPVTKEKVKKYWQKRFQTEASVKARIQIRRRIRQAIVMHGKKPYPVKSSVDHWLGCTVYEFVKYIEKKFKPGMTWKNIHIDHIKPVCSFDLSTLKEQKKCFHYSNCQPLWPHENFSKGNKT